VLFQHPTSSLSAALPEIFSRPFLEALKWTTRLDHISSDTGMALTDTFYLAQDRSQWRAVATAAKATRTWLTYIYFSL